MQSPIIRGQDRQDEERDPAGLITAKLIDIQLKWLPILEYEESKHEKTPGKSSGKKL